MPLQKKVLRVKWCSCAEKKMVCFVEEALLRLKSEENETILMTRSLRKGWSCVGFVHTAVQ